MVKELLQLDFFLEDTGLKVELVSWYEDENAENDQVIQLRLRVVDPKKRKDKHKENEAIQFDFDLKKDNPENVAKEMVKSGFLQEEEIRIVSKQIRDRITQASRDNDRKIAEAQQKASEQNQGSASGQDGQQTSAASQMQQQTAQTPQTTQQQTPTPQQQSQGAPTNQQQQQQPSTPQQQPQQTAAGAGTIDGNRVNLSQQASQLDHESGSEFAYQHAETAGQNPAQAANLSGLDIFAAQQYQQQMLQQIAAAGSFSAPEPQLVYPPSSGILDEIGRESESDGTAPAITEKSRRKSRIKRRRSEKGLKLTILSVEAEGQEVECRLDIANKNSVTYKFTLENDKPEEIADNLVGVDLLPEAQVNNFIDLMEGAIKLVKHDPSSAVSLCISAANTPTSSPCVTRKSRHSAEMDSAKKLHFEQADSSRGSEGGDTESESKTVISNEQESIVETKKKRFVVSKVQESYPLEKKPTEDDEDNRSTTESVSIETSETAYECPDVPGPAKTMVSESDAYQDYERLSRSHSLPSNVPMDLNDLQEKLAQLTATQKASNGTLSNTGATPNPMVPEVGHLNIFLQNTPITTTPMSDGGSVSGLDMQGKQDQLTPDQHQLPNTLPQQLHAQHQMQQAQSHLAMKTLSQQVHQQMLNSLQSQDPNQLPHIPQTPATSAAYTTHDPNVQQHSAHNQLPPSAYTQHIPTNQQQYFLQQQQMLQYPGLLIPYLYATDPFMHIRMQHLLQMCKTMEQVQMQQTGQIPMMANLFPPMYSFLQTNMASMPTSDMSAGISQPSPPQSPSQSQPENEASAHHHGHASHLSEQDSHENLEMKTPTDLANLEQALIEKLRIHKKDPSLLSYQATSSTSSMTTGTGGSEYDYQQSLTIESRDEVADHVPVGEVGFHEESLSSHEQSAPDGSATNPPAPSATLPEDASSTEDQSTQNKKSRFVVSTVREDPITPNPSEESSPAMVESPQALLEDNMHSSGQRFHTTKKGRFHVTSMHDSLPTAASSFTNTAPTPSPPPPQMPPDVNGLRVCTSTAQMAEDVYPTEEQRNLIRLENDEEYRDLIMRQKRELDEIQLKHKKEVENFLHKRGIHVGDFIKHVSNGPMLSPIPVTTLQAVPGTLVSPLPVGNATISQMAVNVQKSEELFPTVSAGIPGNLIKYMESFNKQSRNLSPDVQGPCRSASPYAFMSPVQSLSEVNVDSSPSNLETSTKNVLSSLPEVDNNSHSTNSYKSSKDHLPDLPSEHLESRSSPVHWSSGHSDSDSHHQGIQNHSYQQTDEHSSQSHYNRTVLNRIPLFRQPSLLQGWQYPNVNLVPTGSTPPKKPLTDHLFQKNLFQIAPEQHQKPPPQDEASETAVTKSSDPKTDNPSKM